MLWQVHFYFHSSPTLVQKNTLFKTEHKQTEVPVIADENIEIALDQIGALSFPLCSPFELIDSEYLSKHKLLVKDLNKRVNKNIEIIGYLVTAKRTSTSGGNRMNFGTFLDSSGAFLDTVHFPNSTKKYPFRGRGIYLLRGKVVEEYDFMSLEVNSMHKVPYMSSLDD